MSFKQYISIAFLIVVGFVVFPPAGIAMILWGVFVFLRDISNMRKRAKAEKKFEEQNTLFSEKEYTFIATPKDMKSLAQAANMNLDMYNGLYGYATIPYKTDDDYFDVPDLDDINWTTDISDVAREVRGGTFSIFKKARRFVIFSKDTLHKEINGHLAQEGQKPLNSKHALYIYDAARKVGMPPTRDIYTLGEGYACMSLPDDPDEITPQFTVEWMADIMNYIAAEPVRDTMAAPAL